MANLDNLQGDLFSRGFSKLNETYYFFSIVPNKEKDFTKALNVLGKSGQISSVKKVLEQWAAIDDLKAQQRAQPNVDFSSVTIPIANALIAFTKKGLDKIQTGLAQAGLPGDALGLNQLTASDPAFAAGMAADRPNLNDPPVASWDPLFRTTTPIHGVIKVAGNDANMVNSKLIPIQTILKLGTLITDIVGQSPPTSVNSRIDGQVRPREKGLNGHEHFGFEDGISQPLLQGIDKAEALKANPAMLTPQNVITVSTQITGNQRPDWMNEGSFFVFRKLEQNVPAFNEFCANKFNAAGCTDANQCAAKLMGRWKSGAPITEFPDKDPPKDPKTTDPKTGARKFNNEFTFANTPTKVCPLGAHIRKTNPRDTDDFTKSKRIVRNGIPYGKEISDDPNGKRGLLFACYQSSIESGFQFIQQSWVDSQGFPFNNFDAGFDPIIGQAPNNDPLLQTTMFDANNNPLAPGPGKFNKWVTMRGGDYFFVPSISALTTKLGST